MHISLTKIGGLTIGKWVSNKKYIWFLGRPKCQKKKSDIQQNLLFEDPGWERLEHLKYRNFWSFQVFSGSSHALAALSIT